MESEASHSARIIKLLAWLEVNKKRVLIWSGAVVAVVLAVVVFVLMQQQREAQASQALSEIRLFTPEDKSEPSDAADALLKLAQNYSGTKAAARALLVRAGLLYQDGHYPEAQSQFEAMLREYPDSPWAAQAAYGVAASLDAEKKVSEAIAKYEDLRRRYPSDPIVDEARLALARLYEGVNRKEEAYQIYDELARANPGSGLGAEAGMRRDDLVSRFPELAKTNTLPLATLTAPDNAVSNLIKTVRTNPVVATNAIRTLITNTIKVNPVPPATSAAAPKVLAPAPAPGAAPIPAPAPKQP
jgi:outer membrane protein assembly factor BamD (BamD/ComL family)